MNYKDKKFIIVTHVFSYGKSQALHEYLKDKTDVLFIGHPLNGNVFSWIFQFFNTILKVIKSKKKYDIYFGSNNLNSLAGVILKKARFVQKVIFYTPDSPPNRFKNKFLNKIYHWIDYYCLKHADSVWNNSNNMVCQREKRGVSQDYREKQIEVPMGTDNIPLPDFENINRFEVVFVGHIREQQGLFLLLDAFKNVIEKQPEAKLLIIGTGPIENELKLYAKDMDYVCFAGYMPDVDKVYSRIVNSAIAVAPYEPDSIIQHTDSGKVKLYLSAGLPIVLTKTATITDEIDRKKCGFAIEYSSSDLSQKILKLLLDESLLREYRANVVKLRKKYNYNNLFDNALKKCL